MGDYAEGEIGYGFSDNLIYTATGTDDMSLGFPSSIHGGSKGLSLSLTTLDDIKINSRYLGPARELLKEFCNLESDETWRRMNSTQGHQNQSLYSLDIVELQTRKTTLIQLLEQVERRYKQYCNQMKCVVSSFEAVVGNGGARVYTSMASKAMSRHFRCLKDGIVSEIKAIKKVIGEKGTSKGETPRLRVLDQTIRQQKALHQMTSMETHPWRHQRGLPERSVSLLRAWLFEHFLHPYPSDVDKHILARQTGLSRSQVSNWFINARVRLWKPMVEEMYLEDLKENQDQKPTQDQLQLDCLSSVIAKSQPTFADDYASMHFDFSSYNNHHNTGTGTGTGTGTSVGGVSLTLGMGLEFSSTAQTSIFYHPRDHAQDFQYSSLLHDLAG